MKRRGGSAGRGKAPGRARETWLSGEAPAPLAGADVLSVALCYPSSYLLGMSNLGFQSVLGLLRGAPGVHCERAFRADGRGSRKGQDTLAVREGATVESGTPLSEFDVVAFSVSFEDDYFNMVALLDAGGIPVLSADRTEDDPIVVAGGVCAHINAEPVAPFLDAVLVGEAAPIVGPLLECVRGSAGEPRVERVRRLSTVGGAYVPALYTPERNALGRIRGFRVERGAPLPVRPAEGPAGMAVTTVLSDGAFFSDMALMESSRGCGRGCRFCAAGSVMRPRTWRPAVEVLAAMREVVAHTNRVGLVTAALLDHPEVAEILGGAVDMGVEVNISSVRAEAVTPEIAALLSAAGVRTVTIAPETGCEDLRRVVGKPTTDEDLFRAVEYIAGAGIESLKLYFMIGVPGETEDDVAAIPRLSRELRTRFLKGRGSGRVAVSVSAFVPKPRTPFQWMPMAEEVHLRRTLSALRKAFVSRPRIEFSGTGPREARREGLLARGGRELAGAISAVVLEDIPWKAAVKRAGVDARVELGRVRGADEIFAWEIVDVGTPREKLAASLARARELLEARG